MGQIEVEKVLMCLTRAGFLMEVPPEARALQGRHEDEVEDIANKGRQFVQISGR